MTRYRHYQYTLVEDEVEDIGRCPHCGGELYIYDVLEPMHYRPMHIVKCAQCHRIINRYIGPIEDVILGTKDMLKDRNEVTE